MLELGGEPDLLQEPLCSQPTRDLGMEDLQGDGSVVPQIPGEPDRGYPTPAELPDQGVAIGQGSAELALEIGHWESGGGRS